MSEQNPHSKRNREHRLLGLGFLILALIGITIAAFLNQSYYKAALKEAESLQKGQSQVVVTRVRNFLLSAAQLAETLRVFLEQYDGQDRVQIENYLDRIVESAPADLVYGAGAWYEPYTFEKQTRYFGPYVHRGSAPDKRVLTYEWTTEAYNFHSQAW